MLTYNNIKLSAIVNTSFTMLCQNECHKLDEEMKKNTVSK